MKISLKGMLAISAAVIMLHVSCKKTVITPADTKSNLDVLSKKLAFDIYRSLSGNVDNTDKIKNNETRQGSVRTMEQPGCGLAVKRTKDSSAVSGDTTRTFIGNSIFTYMCNGYFHDNYRLDAYTLADTLKTTEKGTGFNNVYNVTLNYAVKTLDPYYSFVSIDGRTTTSDYTSKVTNGETTEFHQISTVYTLNELLGQRVGNKTVYKLGGVNFTTATLDKDATTSADGKKNNYSGHMVFSGNTLHVFFDAPNGTFKKFIIDLTTGETTAVE